MSKAKKPYLAVVLGTRPEIIKMSPVIRLLESRRAPYFVVHTGQHYSFHMDEVFFRDLELPTPKYKLSVHQSPAIGHGHHVGRMLAELESIFLKERPDAVMVQGDTNTVLAGALVASKIHGIKVAHVEAGLRSYDRQMPEEINRVICDHISDYLFAPTKGTQRILLGEGIDRKKIHVTGNTIVDAVRQASAIAKKRGRLPAEALAAKNGYFFMTMHRQENVDHKDRLASILRGVDRVARRFDLPVIFPAHPRATSKIKEFGLTVPPSIRVIEPAGFLDFLRLEQGARMALSDSGGVQEETCILGIPCVTLRTSTERPETVEVGANLLAGYHEADILKAAEKMMRVTKKWSNPFGDGRSAERMVKILTKDLS